MAITTGIRANRNEPVMSLGNGLERIWQPGSCFEMTGCRASDPHLIDDSSESAAANSFGPVADWSYSRVGHSCNSLMKATCHGRRHWKSQTSRSSA